MTYPFLLAVHSWIRWLVLAALLSSSIRAYRGWLGGYRYTPVDEKLRLGTLAMLWLQLAAGLWLYGLSPIVHYFYRNFPEAVHLDNIRFFGMEHITMMTIAIFILTLGGIRAGRQPTDKRKFRAMAIWFTIGLLLIFISIPWKFSPFTARPYFRAF